MAVATLLRSGREWKASRLLNEKLQLELVQLRDGANAQREKLELELRQLRAQVERAERRVILPSEDQMRRIDDQLKRLIHESASGAGASLITSARAEAAGLIDSAAAKLQREVEDMRISFDANVSSAFAELGGAIHGMDERLQTLERALKEKKGIFWRAPAVQLRPSSPVGRSW